MTLALTIEYHTKQIAIADSWLERFEDAAIQAFEDDRAMVLAMVADNRREALRRKAMPNWNALGREIGEYFSGASAENWQSIFAPVIEGIIGETGEEWSAILGVSFDVRNLAGEEWFQEYILEFAQDISQTSNDVIQQVIAQGLASDSTVDELADQLGMVFEQWMQGTLTKEDFEWLQARMPDFRREMIARTESLRALNTGTFELGKSWGMTEKEWLTEIDGRERDSHHSANKQRRAMDQPFDVGTSQLMHPLDSSLGASPDEIINCRCTLLLHR